MLIPFWRVDAFAEAAFAGNPAGVCLLDAFLPDALMQAIAAENALPETAFLVAQGDSYALRWFTPTVEVPLCGHATLAAGSVVLRHLRPQAARVAFETQSGTLVVARAGAAFALDLPLVPPRAAVLPPGLAAMLGQEPVAYVQGGDNGFAVLADEAAVRGAAPDLAALATLPVMGLGITAPGRSVDFVSRYFAPRAGIPEDPVTGSAHATLAPYWAARLGRDNLHARQVGPREGVLACQVLGARVVLTGHCVETLEGRIPLP
ncbi:PhzF family phenazine biosynthesis protein [Zavarzinia sp. CC-PAN008]|uniref:PhzF family phenazine biosynthesis protein n=1 Tax=Zavarzinia sp. CC-PAN008 TaxID=3243332 RepID=UPI003F742A36